MSEAEKIAALRAYVAKAGAQFEFYEGQHRAKGTLEATAKADTNKALADEAHTLLLETGAEET